jgi:hypothetical protein
MRRYLAVLPLAAILTVVGCHFIKPAADDNRVAAGPFHANVEPKAADLVAYMNDNARKVPGLYCKQVYIDAKQGNQSFGMDGQLSCEKPRDFRMKAKVAGNVVGDFGSNQDEFWYWISKAEPPYVFHGKYDDMKTAGVQLPIPFQPDIVIAALGMGEYDPNANYTLKPNKEQNIVELYEPTTSIQGKPMWKVTVFNRGAVTAAKPQVLAYLLKDQDGKDVAIARVTGTEVNRETKAVLPKSIHLTLFLEGQAGQADKVEMKLVFDNLQVVTFDREQKATMFALGDALGGRQGYDLALRKKDTEPGGIGMGMSIQRTNANGYLPPK